MTDTVSKRRNPTVRMGARVSPLALDLNEPLLPQVFAMSKENYLALSNEVVHSRKVFKLLPYKVLEPFTKMYWWAVPLIYLPIVVALITHTQAKWDLPTNLVITMWASGVFIWTIAEYIIHRFIFHFPESWLPDYSFVRIIHFVTHQIHHLLPSDPMRLVMPPLLLFSLMTPLYFIASSIAPIWLVRGIWSGILCGYIAYDTIHFAEHHFSLDVIPGLAFMKRYHMKHHFKLPDLGYGVTTPLWDFVFGTGYQN